MSVDHRRLGVGLVVAGLVLLLTLRIWASPLVVTVMGRSRVGVVAFLGIPLFLLVVAAGIVVFFWGEELGLG